MTADTQELFGPVGDELRAVEESLHKMTASDPAEVGRPMIELLEAGGKRIRPALVLLCGKCGTYDGERLLPAAMSVEMIHAATLVHDDVIDRSPTRRGRPTVAARLGDEPAIVIGDFYFSRAYMLAAMSRVPEAVGIVAVAVMGICVGEVRQQAIRFRYSTGVEEYMKRIEAKTARLLAASCKLGAFLGQVEPKQLEALEEYGRLVGLAFQITDDVLDYTATEGEIGKPIGHDVAEGFATLPLMLAMQDANAARQLAKLLDDGRRLTADDARRVVDIVRATDAPDRALDEARRHAAKAREQLALLPRDEAVDALHAIADYVVTRKL